MLGKHISHKLYKSHFRLGQQLIYIHNECRQHKRFKLRSLARNGIGFGQRKFLAAQRPALTWIRLQK